MKKLLSILFVLLLSITVFSPLSEASTYNLKNKSLNLPNLYSYSNAKAMKNASFKYYSLKLRQNQPTMLNTWGSPASSSVTKSFGYSSGSYFYGADYNVLVSTQATGEKASRSKYLIESFTITSQNNKYELSKIKKYFGSPTSSYTSGNYKSNDYGKYINMTFKKVGSKWYVDTLIMHKYGFQ
ncbi:hypothetical protein [Macrococcus animalis]|uniref:hypothetical protein n=1 Tax=Macrococcus animalis TaxID=3395467 RepID=UPI0039BE207A